MPRVSSHQTQWIRWRGLAVRVKFKTLSLDNSEKYTSLATDLQAWQRHKAQPSSRKPDLAPESEIMSTLKDVGLELIADRVTRLDAAEAGAMKVDQAAQAIIERSKEALDGLAALDADTEALETLWCEFAKVAPISWGIPDTDALTPLELELDPDAEDPEWRAWNDATKKERLMMLAAWPKLFTALMQLVSDRQNTVSLLGK